MKKKNYDPQFALVLTLINRLFIPKECKENQNKCFSFDENSIVFVYKML